DLQGAVLGLEGVIGVLRQAQADVLLPFAKGIDPVIEGRDLLHRELQRPIIAVYAVRPAPDEDRLGGLDRGVREPLPPDHPLLRPGDGGRRASPGARRCEARGDVLRSEVRGTASRWRRAKPRGRRAVPGPLRRARLPAGAGVRARGEARGGRVPARSAEVSEAGGALLPVQGTAGSRTRAGVSGGPGLCDPAPARRRLSAGDTEPPVLTVPRLS